MLMVFVTFQSMTATNPYVLSAIPECIGIAWRAFDRNLSMPLSSKTDIDF